jgi:hypothetical protein
MVEIKRILHFLTSIAPSLAALMLIFVSIPATGAENPRALVDTAIERMGGREVIDSVQRLSTEEDGLQYHVMDAERPGPPFFPDYFHAEEQIDFHLPALRRKFTAGADALYGNNADTVFTANGASALNQRNGKTVPRRTPTPRHWLLQNPVAVLRAALAANDLKSAADVTLLGITQRCVSFHQEGTFVQLFFNPFNGYLSGSEITTTELWEAIWDIADVRLKTIYTSWELEAGGFHYPLQWDVFFDDYPFQTRTISKVSINPNFNADQFHALADEAIPVAGNVDDFGPGPPDRPISEIAPGVLQVTPGPRPANFSTVIVKQADGIVVIEAPTSSGWSSRIIEEVNHRFPGMPIKALVTADNIWWHFAGIREYAARGIPIYVLDQNAALVRSVLATPRTLNPDTLQRQPRKPKLIEVSRETTIGSGPNRVVLYPIRASTNQMMMAYLPDHQLLYTADMAGPFGPAGLFVFPQSIWELRSEVQRQSIKVETLIGIHLLPTSWSKLESQLQDVLKSPAH